MDAKQQSARVSVLIASGLLLGLTAAGWLSHANKATPETAPVQVASVGVQTAQVAGTPQQGMPPQTADQSTKATNMWDAVKVAHQEAGRANPMAPPDVNDETSAAPVRTARTAGQLIAEHRRSTSRPRHSGFVIPPPPDISEYTGQQGLAPQVLPEPEPPRSMPKLVIGAEMRLVGLLDEKAIFSLPRDAAARLSLPKSVTLGAGQCWNGIKLVAITKDSATLSDESNRLFQKHLQPIH